MAYASKADGSVGERAVFFDATAAGKAGKKGLPDGLKVDVDGQPVRDRPGRRARVHARTASTWARIVTGEPTANCAFGDDGSTLYMTANDKLMRIRLRTAGCRRIVTWRSKPDADSDRASGGTASSAGCRRPGSARLPPAARGGGDARAGAAGRRHRGVHDLRARASSSAARCWRASSARPSPTATAPRASTAPTTSRRWRPSVAVMAAMGVLIQAMVWLGMPHAAGLAADAVLRLHRHVRRRRRHALHADPGRPAAARRTRRASPSPTSCAR